MAYVYPKTSTQALVYGGVDADFVQFTSQTTSLASAFLDSELPVVISIPHDMGCCTAIQIIDDTPELW